MGSIGLYMTPVKPMIMMHVYMMREVLRMVTVARSASRLLGHGSMGLEGPIRGIKKGWWKRSVEREEVADPEEQMLDGRDRGSVEVQTFPPAASTVREEHASSERLLRTFALVESLQIKSSRETILRTTSQ